MATLALFAAGSALGGAVGGSATVFGISAAALGGAVGGFAGGLIDSTLLFPALLGSRQPDIIGPRIDDYRLQTASEGSGVNFCMGPENRVSGTLIWAGPLEETKRTEDVDGGKGGGGGGSITTFKYFESVAIGVCDGVRAAGIGGIKKIWADSKVLYDVTETPETVDARYTSISLYVGSDTQTADSVISAAEVAANTPGFRHTAYVVVEQLALADFGNRLPNFTFLVSEPEDEVGGEPGSTSVAQAISLLMARTRITVNDYDVTKVNGCLKGYNVVGPQETAKVLEPLMIAHDLVVQESEGKLHFITRGFQAAATTVVPGDLAAHNEGEGFPDEFIIEEAADASLPMEVIINYIDVENDYQTGTQRERRAGTLIQTDHTVTISLPLTMDAVQAKQLAFRRLWGAWAERRQVFLTLPLSYIYLEEEDRISVTYSSETYNLRIIRITRGVSGVLEIVAHVEELTTRLTPIVVDIPGGPGQPPLPYTPPPTTFQIKDIAPLQDDHVNQPGFYWSAAPTTRGKPWQGSSLHRSFDDVDYTAINFLSQAGSIGETSGGTLFGAGIDPYTWDRKSSLEVTLKDGTLESRSEIDVLNGVNHMLIGSEVVGFKTATLVSDGVYTLSTFIRGRRGTEQEINTHWGKGEDVMLLKSGLLNFVPIQFSAIGALRRYKGVPVGGTVASFTAQTFTPDAKTLEPWPPSHLAGTRDGSDNLTLTWVRRIRMPWRHFGTLSVPILQQHSGYEVDIYDAIESTGSLLRTKTIASATTQTVTYTAAEQTTDGMTPGDPVHIEVFEMHELIGRGRGTERTTI